MSGRFKRHRPVWLALLFFLLIVGILAFLFKPQSFPWMDTPRVDQAYALKDESVELVGLPKLQSELGIYLDSDQVRSTLSLTQSAQIDANRQVDTTSPASQSGGVITFKDIETPYIQDNGNAIAPEKGAATWFGTGDVADGKPTHFIGHTPGDFYWLFAVGVGDRVTVTDGAGQTATYEIVSITDTNDQGEDRSGVPVLGDLLAISGESINLQTCYDDHWNIVLHGVLVVDE